MKTKEFNIMDFRMNQENDIAIIICADGGVHNRNVLRDLPFEARFSPDLIDAVNKMNNACTLQEREKFRNEFTAVINLKSRTKYKTYPLGGYRVVYIDPYKEFAICECNNEYSDYYEDIIYKEDYSWRKLKLVAAQRG